MSEVHEKLARKAPSTARQVRLNLRYISVWSGCKVSFLVGIALGFLPGVVVIILWATLERLGTFAQLDHFFSSGTSGSGSVSKLFGFSQVFAIVALIGMVNVFFCTIVGTIAAALYNLGVRFFGGIVVGLTAEPVAR